MSNPVLRLVTNETSHLPAPAPVAGVSRARVRSNEQLCFDFEDLESKDSHRIEIVSIDGLHGNRLCELILSKRPKIAIDLRYAVRFDLPGTSREQVLMCFNTISTLYLREPLPWHNLQRKDFISGDRVISQRLENEAVKQNRSPLMVFVPKKEHASFMSAYLNRVFSSRSESPWEIIANH